MMNIKMAFDVVSSFVVCFFGWIAGVAVTLGVCWSMLKKMLDVYGLDDVIYSIKKAVRSTVVKIVEDEKKEVTELNAHNKEHGGIIRTEPTIPTTKQFIGYMVKQAVKNLFITGISIVAEFGAVSWVIDHAPASDIDGLTGLIVILTLVFVIPAVLKLGSSVLMAMLAYFINKHNSGYSFFGFAFKNYFYAAVGASCVYAVYTVVTKLL